jgi:hypothetical protein
MKKIPLSNRDFPVLVSDEDYDFLSQFSWFAKASRSGDYACASVRNGRKVITLRMHRVIAGCYNGKTVDHLNGNHFDNQRENLEIVTSEENIKRYYDLKGEEKFKDTVPF